ncbi:MAG: 50S ribosomal protein L17 [Opitutales bacterium]|nr:50S ribosomal protein L17 [Opitutales bacterium]
MRHNKHRHQMGVKKEHRASLMASLASALFRHDRIETTLGYAKALRPFAEKVITLAKKAAATEDTAKKLHYRRNALAKLRDVSAVHFLFAEKVSKFLNRQGGYTRIYKLVPRKGDAADMAIIELIEADDQGYKAVEKPAEKAEEAVAEKKPAKKAATKKATAKKTATKKATKKVASAEAEKADEAK